MLYVQIAAIQIVPILNHRNGVTKWTNGIKKENRSFDGPDSFGPIWGFILLTKEIKMEIINKADLPIAEKFILAQLSKYDTSQVDWFKLLPLSVKPFHGYCKYPQREKKYSRKFLNGYQIRCSVNVNPSCWPYGWDENVGTWQKKINGILHWGYKQKRIILMSSDEAAVFLAGHEVFHFLKHSRQIDGQNTQCQANKFGIEWLEEFRKRRIK